MRLNEIFTKIGHEQLENVPIDDVQKPYVPADKYSFRGPHEGREVYLMKTGQKPAALISKWLYEDSELKNLVEQGKLKLFVLKHPTSSDSLYIITQPDQEWRGRKLVDIYQNIYKRKSGMTDSDHAKIGLLLGYSKSDIQQFLAAKKP